MHQSVDDDLDGTQNCAPVARLQCALNVSDGFRHVDLSFGVHVSCDTPLANLHELSGTGKLN